MTIDHANDGLERLIDANLNRLGEGIRVIEDVCRYIYDDTTLTPRLKSIRHDLQKAHDPRRLIHRDIQNDILKSSTPSELQRTSLTDMMLANFSRAEESARVLEESFKLIDVGLAELFKHIRYELYDLEKIFFEAHTPR